jgi:hypothetical protein
MIRKSVLIAAAVLIAPLMHGQFIKPVIAFDVTDYDFKNINETDGPVSYEFEYTNTGKVPLIVQNVHASCGCTTPEWTKEPVVPGQEGKIKVSFDPKNRPGPFTKTITVTSNADPSVATLTIRGTVIPVKLSRLVNSLGYMNTIGDLKLQSVHASFGDVMMGDVDTVSINIVNASSDKTLHLSFLKIPEYLTVTYSSNSFAPGEMGKINFILSTAKRNEWDYILDKLFLMINGEMTPNNVISLTANVKEDFSGLTPDEFRNSAVVSFDTGTYDFGSVGANVQVAHDFILTNKGKSDLFIRKVTATCGCTAVEPAKTIIAPGTSTIIKATYNTTGRSGPDKKAITVITNDPRQPRTILWIKASVGYTDIKTP